MHSVFLEGTKLDPFEWKNEEGKMKTFKVFSARSIPGLAIYIQRRRKYDGSFGRLLQHVRVLCVVSALLVSDCGGNRDISLFVRQALGLKILGFDDGKNVTHYEVTSFERKTVWGSRKNLFVTYAKLTTGAHTRTHFMLETK